jgi:hypothetical protein
MYEECVNLLTAEKPVFAKKYSPCHPTGFVMETDYDINKTMGIHAQLGYMSGTGGTFDDEHDINLGFQFHTPIQGLSIGGFYTDWQWHVDEYVFDPESMEMVLDRDIYDGYRAGFGYNFDEFNIHLRGEYYSGKGFKDRVDTTMSFEDMEMNAFFIEAGYSFNIGHEQLSYIQPYIHHQRWNQAVNLDGDYILSLVTFGANFGIGANDHARLKIEYQTCATFPNDGVIIPYGENQHADRMIVRFQIGI